MLSLGEALSFTALAAVVQGEFAYALKAGDTEGAMEKLRRE